MEWAAVKNHIKKWNYYQQGYQKIKQYKPKVENKIRIGDFFMPSERFNYRNIIRDDIFNENKTKTRVEPHKKYQKTEKKQSRNQDNKIQRPGFKFA